MHTDNLKQRRKNIFLLNILLEVAPKRNRTGAGQGGGDGGQGHSHTEGTFSTLKRLVICWMQKWVGKCLRKSRQEIQELTCCSVGQRSEFKVEHVEFEVSNTYSYGLSKIKFNDMLLFCYCFSTKLVIILSFYLYLLKDE